MSNESTEPKMPMPVAGKAPLKVNVFECARQSNSQLLPLFPYLGPGDIVPCCSSFETDGAPGRIGYFLHSNSVDEVAVSFGSNGRARTADVFVGPRVHGVGGDSGAAYFTMMVITQRQLETGEQPESITFQCEKCNTVLYRHDFDASVAPGEFAALPTIVGSAAAAQTFNNSEDKRTCAACGHLNPRFPLELWGWGRYVWNTGVAAKAIASFQEVTR